MLALYLLVGLGTGVGIVLLLYALALGIYHKHFHVRRSHEPIATMEKAWAEHDRLRAEGYHLQAEGYGVVMATAKALYGKDAIVDWAERTVKAREETP